MFSLAVLIGRGLDHNLLGSRLRNILHSLPLLALFSFQGIYLFSYRLRSRAAYFLFFVAVCAADMLYWEGAVWRR